MSQTPQEQVNLTQDQLKYLVDASLLDFLEEDVIVQLRSYQIIGHLIYFNTDLTLHLSDASRIWVSEEKYATEKLGSVAIRPSEIVFIGQLDISTMFDGLQEGSVEELKSLLSDEINTILID